MQEPAACSAGLQEADYNVISLLGQAVKRLAVCLTAEAEVSNSGMHHISAQSAVTRTIPHAFHACLDDAKYASSRLCCRQPQALRSEQTDQQPWAVTTTCQVQTWPLCLTAPCECFLGGLDWSGLGHPNHPVDGFLDVCHC